MFDPNIPADHADLTGLMFRGQFQALKALIDAVSGVTSAVVDRVTTGNPGERVWSGGADKGLNPSTRKTCEGIDHLHAAAVLTIIQVL